MLMDPLYAHTHTERELNRLWLSLISAWAEGINLLEDLSVRCTDIKNGGFIFVCSPDSKLAQGWWGSVRNREQKKEEDKDRRQRVLRAGAAERWYTIVIDHTDSKQLRMCVICGDLRGFEFPPTVVSFYAHLCVCGRRQMPVQCDTITDRAHHHWAKMCVVPQSEVY